MRILLIAGGWSEEREVSLSGAEQIEKALLASGHEVHRLDPLHELGTLADKAQSCDFAFLNLHGVPGEDGLLQAMLEQYRFPFQGAGSGASILAINKGVTKSLYRAAGIPTPNWEFFPRWTERRQPTLSFPLVVKPNDGGSSVGVGIVHSLQELREFVAKQSLSASPLLIEEYVRGVELSCGVLDRTPLPPVLIRPRQGAFFDYAAKYTAGATEEICPAPVPLEITEQVMSLALAAHDALGIDHYSRTDFIVTDAGPLALETNTLPGMTATSLFPQEAAARGIDFSELLEELIRLGLQRFTA
jgi:D-alanine-D-alanine ligase